MDKKNILYADPMPDWTNQQMVFNLAPEGFCLQYVDATNRPAFEDLIKDADYCITGWSAGSLDKALLCTAPHLKFIQIMGVGYENVNLPDTEELGIPVANTAGLNAAAVSEHIIMFLLCYWKHFIKAHNALKQGNWIYQEIQGAGIQEMAGKTVGIIGLGNVGVQLAKRLAAFDAAILYFDTERKAEAETFYNCQYCGVEKLLRQSDAVVVQVPLTEQTKHFISGRELSLMRPDAVLVNTARGTVVDEDALYQALKNKHIGAACLDCFQQEPLSGDNPLRKLDNVLLTPHMAGASIPVFERSIRLAYENILRVDRNEKPINQVNKIS